MKACVVFLFICSISCASFNSFASVNLLVRPAKKEQIDCFNDALAHYRSGAGGTIPAKKLIDEELIKDRTYVAFKQRMVEQVRKELANVDINATSGSINYASKEKQNLDSTTLGLYGLNNSYSYSWTATAFKDVDGKECRNVSTTAPVNMSLDGMNYWDFDPNTTYSGIKNSIHEKLPGLIAQWNANGTCKAFTITINFSDSLGKFTVQQCKA